MRVVNFCMLISYVYLLIDKYNFDYVNGANNHLKSAFFTREKADFVLKKL